MSCIIGAKLVLTCRGALLTYLRDDFAHIPFPAMWDLPGGGIEPGESAEACALRELEEEFGLRLAPQRLTGRRDFPAAVDASRIGVMFSAAITDREIEAIRFGPEGQHWQMMPITDYIAHPRAVPAFRERVALMTGRAQIGAVEESSA